MYLCCNQYYWYRIHSPICVVQLSYCIHCYLIFPVHTHITHSEAPSAPPRSPSGIAVSSTVVTLTWSSPPLIDINGIIRNYVIRIRERETSRVWIFQATNSHINITSLHPYYNYECEVAAHTIATGPYTDPVSVQTMEAGN